MIHIRMTETEAEREISSWSSHPIVSLLVWVLGANLSKDQEETRRDSSSDLRVVPASNITEYLQDIQHVDSAHKVDSDKGSGTQLVPRIKNLNLDQSNGEQDSPQWGFYVSITPPQNEHFSSGKRTPVDLVSINEEYQRSSQESK